MKFSSVLGCVVCVGFAVVASASDPGSQKIQAGMDAYCRAILGHDNPGAMKILDKFFAPDAVFVAKDGSTMKLDKWKQTIEVTMAQMKISQISLKLATFNVRGNMAIGTEIFHLKGSMPDASNPKKQSVIVILDQSEVTFKKVGDRWLTSKSKVLAEKISLNGNPMKG